MNRRAFAAGAGAIALAACSKKAAFVPSLTFATAEQLMARVKANGAAKKLTALHFWATWCGPCVEEFPLLEREWQGWMREESRLEFLAVSVDEPDPLLAKEKGVEESVKRRDEAVLRFVGAQAATFPVAIALSDAPETFAMAIDEGWPAVLPTTILFGFDGAVAQRQLGELKVSRFRDKVRELLASA